MIVSLIPDLIFSSKVSQLAREAGLAVVNVKGVEQLKEQVLTAKPSLVMLDLNAKGVKSLDAVRFLKEYEDSHFGKETLRIVAFYSHVDKEVAEAAKREGLKEVFSRSEFTKLVPEFVASAAPGRQAGAGRLTILVFGALTAALLFCAYHIMPFYYYYWDLENQMQQVIRIASTTTDKEIRQKILAHIKAFEIPADPEQLKIERDGNYMRISLPYEEVFYITWRGKDYDIHTFEFDAYAEGNF